MRFRPCIDIHNGKVKQIVGGTLKDRGEGTKENYVSDRDAAFYAALYRDRGLKGGHIAMLNAAGTAEYELTKKAAISALNAFPGGLQIGGGVNTLNAADFIDSGASHVIVTSYVFRDGVIDFERLDGLKETVGKERIVLDLSCRLKDGDYYVVTDRWQKFTEHRLERGLFDRLSGYCDEFLVHAVDVEGRKSGIDINVVDILADIPYTITYAGGISCIDDVLKIREAGNGHIDVTIGSALSLFGGNLDLSEVIECIR